MADTSKLLFINGAFVAANTVATDPLLSSIKDQEPVIPPSFGIVSTLIGDVTGTTIANVVTTITGTAAGIVSDAAVEVSAATPAATASTLAKRDSAGIFSVADPTASAHTATKNYIDTNAELITNKDVAGGYPGLNSEGSLVAILVPRQETATNLNAIVLTDGEIATTSDTFEFRIGDGILAGGSSLDFNTSYAIVVQPNGTPAENGQSLLDAYAVAKALTPGGSAKSADNRAKLLMQPGRYDISGIAPLVLDTEYLDVIGKDGSAAITIVIDDSNNIEQNEDNITLQGFTIDYIDLAVLNKAAISYNAGAGGGFAAANAGIKHTDLNFDMDSTGLITVRFNASITTISGTYTKIITNAYALYSGEANTFIIDATFTDCATTAGQVGNSGGGSFGGGNQASGIINVFTGVLTRCVILAAHIGLVVRGRMEWCRIRNNKASLPAVYGGDGGAFWYNWFDQADSGTPYSIGFVEDATISAGHNVMRANGIDETDHTGESITNNIDTPYNITDNDYQN